MRKAEPRRPNFVVTKYRGKTEIKRGLSKRTLDRNENINGGLQVPTIRANDLSTRMKPASRLLVPTDKALTVKEVNFDVPTPAPSPATSPKPVLKSKPGKQIYLKACKKFLLTPIKSIRDGLKKKQLACKYITLRERDVEAIALALVDNHFVREILLHNNSLCRMGAEILSETLLHTNFISHVKITNNRLGSEGAKLLCSVVAHNPTIESLDLSGNDFTEKDGKYFKALLETSYHLTDLNLSHNNFMENGAVMISKGLAKNRHLQALDLSWNHIRMKGAEALGTALKLNCSLEKLNLAWNGLHWQGARALASGLRVNNSLTDLDVQCNRMSEECLAELLKGLKQNTALEILRLGQNHLTSAGAYKVLDHFKALESSGIKLLDFGSQPVHDNFETLLGEILQERDIQVIYGMVWHEDRKIISADDVNEDQAFLLNSNPLMVIMECMRLQNFRLVDMFQSLDTDKNAKISIHELVNGLLKINMPLRRDVLLQFLKKIDRDGDGQLDYSEMREAQRIHKKQIRAIQEKKVILEQTEIGRISKHIRNSMRKKYIKNFTSLTEFSSRETTPTPSLNPLSRDPSPVEQSRELKSHDTSSRLLQVDHTPRTVSRVSSTGRILGNISPFSCDSQCMSRNSVTSSLSTDSHNLSNDVSLSALKMSHSTPLPPIQLK